MSEAAVKQTIEKLVWFMSGIENEKIYAWLEHDEKAIELVKTYMQELWKNGWRIGEGIAFYENAELDKLALEIYERAMLYYRGKK